MTLRIKVEINYSIVTIFMAVGSIAMAVCYLEMDMKSEKHGIFRLLCCAMYLIGTYACYSFIRCTKCRASLLFLFSPPMNGKDKFKPATISKVWKFCQSCNIDLDAEI